MKRRWDDYGRQWHADHRERIFDILGRECACCCESESRFLTFDHVYGDGAAERRESGKGTRALRAILKRLEDGELDRYQVLCCNCNFGRQMNGGICPHEESSTTITGKAGPTPDVREKEVDQPADRHIQITHWYRDEYIPQHPTDERPPNRAADLEAACEKFPDWNVKRDFMRNLRRDYAPEHWKAKGIQKKNILGNNSTAKANGPRAVT